MSNLRPHGNPLEPVHNDIHFRAVVQKLVGQFTNELLEEHAKHIDAHGASHRGSHAVTYGISHTGSHSCSHASSLQNSHGAVHGNSNRTSAQHSPHGVANGNSNRISAQHSPHGAARGNSKGISDQHTSHGVAHGNSNRISGHHSSHVSTSVSSAHSSAQQRVQRITHLADENADVQVVEKPSAASSDESDSDDSEKNKAKINFHSSKTVGTLFHLIAMRDVWAVSNARINLIQKKRHNTLKKLQNIAEIKNGEESPIKLADRVSMDESREVSSRFVIRPQSRFRIVWDVLAMILLAYDLVVVPMQVFDLPQSAFLDTMDFIILIYWTCDIPFSFLTGVYVNGQLEMRLAKIAQRYVKSMWLFFDLIIVVPEWIVMLIGQSGGGTTAAASVKLVRASRSTRFLRFLRFLRLLRFVKIERAFQAFKTRINSNFLLLCISISRLIIGIVILVHMLACTWYAIGSLEEDKGWVYVEGIENDPLGDQYIFSFQWAMSRLHPSSFGKNISLKTLAERIFAIIVSLFALAAGGAFISTITNTMAQLQNFRQQRTHKLWVFREYSREHNISVQLSIRVKMFIEKSLNRKLREQHALELASMLPLTLLMDLRFEAWLPLLSEDGFFSTFCQQHPRTVWRLCREAIKEVWVLVGDTVFTTGDVCNRMIFLMTGKLSYVPGRIMGGPDDELDEHTICPGDSLSEPALWAPWENRGELCALGDDCLLSLNVDEFSCVVTESDMALLASVQRAKLVVAWLNKQEDACTDMLPRVLSTILVRQISPNSNGSAEASDGVVPAPPLNKPKKPQSARISMAHAMMSVFTHHSRPSSGQPSPNVSVAEELVEEEDEEDLPLGELGPSFQTSRTNSEPAGKISIYSEIESYDGVEPKVSECVLDSEDINADRKKLSAARRVSLMNAW